MFITVKHLYELLTLWRKWFYVSWLILKSAVLCVNTASPASLKVWFAWPIFSYPFTTWEIYLLQLANPWVLVFNPTLCCLHLSVRDLKPWRVIVTIHKYELALVICCNSWFSLICLSNLLERHIVCWLCFLSSSVCRIPFSALGSDCLMNFN